MPLPTERTKEAMGAFCTDISNSTERIEAFQELALNHHKNYLEAAGRYFVRSVPDKEKINYDLGDLWVPGDALWGVFYPGSRNSHKDSVPTSLWRVITAFAYGLSVANASRPAGIDPLKIRGVFLVGHVMRETLLDKFRLYNGRALNACGRLEKHVAPNTIIAGFVVSKGEQGEKFSVESVARSPVVNVGGAGGLSAYLRRNAEPREAGCSIRLDVVSHNDQRLLRFKGWRSRHSLRGLGNCSVLTTKITLVPHNEPGFEVEYDGMMSWDRTEAKVPNKGGRWWELHELLDQTDCTSIEFVKQVYKKGEVKIHVSSEEGGPFELHCSRKRDRPRVTKSNQISPVVNFRRYPYCVLPTNTHGVPSDANILIQAYTRAGNKVLCFSPVDDNLLSAYDDCEDFIDTGIPAKEFTFIDE